MGLAVVRSTQNLVMGLERRLGKGVQMQLGVWMKVGANRDYLLIASIFSNESGCKAILKN